MNGLDVTRFVVIIGYIVAFGWSAIVLWRNHLTGTSRMITRLALVAAFLWALLYSLIAFDVASSGSPFVVYLARVAQLPSIALILIVVQTLHLGRGR